MPTALSHPEDRTDLAAALRWAERLGLNEGIDNHFSCAVSPDGHRFLVNPLGFHWRELRASDLATAFGGFGNPKTREFTRALDSVLALAKGAATQQRNRIERSKGRNWAGYTKDLRWSALVNKMRTEDGETL